MKIKVVWHCTAKDCDFTVVSEHLRGEDLWEPTPDFTWVGEPSDENDRPLDTHDYRIEHLLCPKHYSQWEEYKRTFEGFVGWMA